VAEIFGERVQALYGEVPGVAAGVVHVTSVWTAPDGCWRSLRIGPETPESAADTLALAAARARADAIVTTGAILRAEPGLDHRLDGLVSGAATWRRESLGLRSPPHSVVLTRRGDLDLDHRLFAATEGASGKVFVLTGEDAAAELRARAAGREDRVVVVARRRPGLRDALAWLRGECAFETVLVEAGVSTATQLYDAPLAVDELLLSIYCAAPPPAVQGEPFLAPDHPVRVRLSAGGGRATVREEASGTWRFERHRLGELTSPR